MSEYLIQHNVISKFDEDSINSFVILSDIERSIKEKIEKIGTPLKDWNINIYRGILTGYNEAFIIDGKTKNDLIEKSPKNAEIIRPILRGRDIKKYGYEFADLWLLYIPWHFPLHKDPLISVASKEAEEEFQKQYPDIYNHLLQYKTQLSDRNKSETGIRYEWYALQRWGANYMDDFFKQKIIWKIIGNHMAFSIDSNKYIVNNACYILTGPNLEYLLSVLNSNVIKWYSYITNMNKTGVGDVQVGGQNMNLFPNPLLIDNQQDSLISLVRELLVKIEKEEDITTLEYRINSYIYNIYNLSIDEIKYLETQ